MGCAWVGWRGEFEVRLRRCCLRRWGAMIWWKVTATGGYCDVEVGVGKLSALADGCGC